MLTAAVESLTDVLAAGEIQPLLPAHWEELGLYRDRMALDPDYDAYRAHDGAGRLSTVILRHAGAVVGYFICFVTPTLHYKSTLTAKMDLIYIKPEHRGGGGVLLEQAMRAELKRRGVQLVYVGSKLHHPIEGFWDALGYERQETYHCMWIGDDDA